MMRFTHCVIVAAAFIGVSVHMFVSMADPDCQSQETKGELLDTKLESCKKFQAEAGQIFAAIVEENLPLDKAVAQIIDASAQHHPEYIRNMKFVKRNYNLNVAVGESILQHFVFAINDGERNLIPILDRLRAEHAQLKSANPQ